MSDGKPLFAPRLSRRLKINAVGPFRICEDCVDELDKVFSAQVEAGLNPHP